MANYIAELSKDVERKHVRYNNRYGLAIAADLYQAKAIDGSGTHPAIIVGAPYGGVKEQGPCVYANELAKRGFVVLTFDQSFMGESAGERGIFRRRKSLRRISAQRWITLESKSHMWTVIKSG